MTHTYVGDLSTDRDKVRFYIGDTVENSGPKPGDGSFTDAEIDGLITAEGSWQRAVAGAFEVLAGLWGLYVDIAVGPRKEALSQTARNYERLATKWREQYGASSSGVGVAHPTRIDGYSDDVSSDED